MDIIYFLVSINKISLIAFLAILGILGYEVYLFRKEKQKKAKPTIPTFQENLAAGSKIQSASLVKEEDKAFLRPNNVLFLVLIILLLMFGLFSLLGFVSSKKKAQERSVAATAPRTSIVTSRGIKLFTPNFVVLPDTEIDKLRPGDEVIIGVETISEADIDRARIRINTDAWSSEDITQNFEKRYNVFYRSYTIATGEGKLKIEAELHSKQDGWLGE